MLNVKPLIVKTSGRASNYIKNRPFNYQTRSFRPVTSLQTSTSGGNIVISNGFTLSLKVKPLSICIQRHKMLREGSWPRRTRMYLAMAIPLLIWLNIQVPTRVYWPAKVRSGPSPFFFYLHTYTHLTLPLSSSHNSWAFKHDGPRPCSITIRTQNQAQLLWVKNKAQFSP